MKKIKISAILILALVLLSFISFNTRQNDQPSLTAIEISGNLLANDGYTVDEFYEKIDLEYGTLDEDGDPIDFVFVKTNLDEGKYEIEITDGPGDLYEIKGTNIFLTFNGYFGYAGYGTECILKVSGGYYSSTVFKIE